MSCRGCRDNQHQKAVIIKNPKSGLVLDGSEYHVTIQYFTGNSAQQWYLECIDHGRFIITNKMNGKVLDIRGPAQSLAKLVTHNKNNNINQQWYIHYDGTIVNAAEGQLVLDIDEGKYYPGNKVIIYPARGKENQIFQIEYDCNCFCSS